MKKKIVIVTETLDKPFEFICNVTELKQELWDTYQYTISESDWQKDKLLLEVGGDLIEITNVG